MKIYRFESINRKNIWIELKENPNDVVYDYYYRTNADTNWNIAYKFGLQEELNWYRTTGDWKEVTVMNKTYRFTDTSTHYWIEIRDAANSMNEYQWRSSNDTSWITLPLLRCANFMELVKIYRHTGTWIEQLAEGELPDHKRLLNEYLEGYKKEPKKCDCHVLILVQRGCQCGGI